MIKLVDSGWQEVFDLSASLETKQNKIMSPFIKTWAAERLIVRAGETTKVLTRFNLNDFAAGVSDTAALKLLLERGARVRGIKNLHSKMYLFGDSRAIITSANLTKAAMTRNHEFGLVSDNPEIIKQCKDYFDSHWEKSGDDLSLQTLESWEDTLRAYFIAGGSARLSPNLGDFGASVTMSSKDSRVPVGVSDAPQALIKIFGEANNRLPLDFPSIEEVRRSGCHWALTYPRRPRRQKDGAVVYIARQTRGPNDMRIFGRAIASSYREELDDATAEEISRRPFKARYPHYIRVHNAEFLSGPLANGVSLNEMIKALDADAFKTSQRNKAQNPLLTRLAQAALKQQPDVELSNEGQEWLETRMQAAFDRYGTIPLHEMRSLDWPEVS